jgi:type II secretory pathway pseudopilin PulG
MSSLPPPPLPPFVVRKKGLAVGVWIAIVAGIGILLLVGVSILAAVGIVGGSSAVKKAKILRARATANSLENAVDQFYREYGVLPGSAKLVSDTVSETSGPEGQQLLSILMGKESGPIFQNPKHLPFFSGKPGTRGKNGLIDLPSGLSELIDPWGNPYHLILDGDGDEALTPPADSGSPTVVKGCRVRVYSLGPNGKGAVDAVRTW